MFATLDEQIKFDEAATTTLQQRIIMWAAVAVSAIVLFGALFVAIELLG